MLKKVLHKLIFNPKRDYTLISPCCNKENKDGKFVNFKGFPNNFGYCHSCGKSNNPPTIYLDEKGNKYSWNTVTQKFEIVSHMLYKNVLQNNKNCNTLSYINNITKFKMVKYIDYQLVEKSIKSPLENNLIKYLRSKYDTKQVDYVIQLYSIGTNKKGGTIFWYINKVQKVRKAKVSYYTEKGKRTNRFEVPFKNADGYYSCLYGEHLLKNNNKPIILVESEKTAIVATIEFPEFTWLSYSGINGLTDQKLQVLANEKIIIVPDISNNAVNIIKKKIPQMKAIKIDVTIYDLTKGKNDLELKDQGLYNCDLEDILNHSIL